MYKKLLIHHHFDASATNLQISRNRHPVRSNDVKLLAILKREEFRVEWKERERERKAESVILLRLGLTQSIR